MVGYLKPKLFLQKYSNDAILARTEGINGSYLSQRY